MSVTVLIPVYGVEKYIEKCAESLFIQTYQNIKYVFCDDCSVDRSVELLRNVINAFPQRANDVTIIRNEKNLGLGGTRKRLMKYVLSDTFMFVDSDDALPRNAVSALVYKMQEADTDIVEGSYSTITKDTVSSPLTPSATSKRRYIKRLLCHYSDNWSLWGKLYKTSLIQKMPDMFVNGINMGEDFCVTARLAYLSSRSCIKDNVYCYRLDNPNSYTSSIHEKDLLSFAMAEKVVVDFYYNHGYYSPALEIGIMNIYRQCTYQRFSMGAIHSILNYHPQKFLFKILFRRFFGGHASFVDTLIFKILRELVLLF